MSGNSPVDLGSGHILISEASLRMRRCRVPHHELVCDSHSVLQLLRGRVADFRAASYVSYLCIKESRAAIIKNSVRPRQCGLQVEAALPTAKEFTPPHAICQRAGLNLTERGLAGLARELPYKPASGADWRGLSGKEMRHCLLVDILGIDNEKRYSGIAVVVQNSGSGEYSSALLLVCILPCERERLKLEKSCMAGLTSDQDSGKKHAKPDDPSLAPKYSIFLACIRLSPQSFCVMLLLYWK